MFWTPEMTNYLHCYYDKKPPAEIARHLNLTESQVKGKIRSIGYKKRVNTDAHLEPRLELPAVSKTLRAVNTDTHLDPRLELHAVSFKQKQLDKELNRLGRYVQILREEQQKLTDERNRNLDRYFYLKQFIRKSDNRTGAMHCASNPKP